MSVDVVIPADAELGEGPCWDAASDRLLWVDIRRGELHVWDGSEDRVTQVEAPLGAAVPTSDGDVLLAFADRLALLSGETLATIPHGAHMRLNDGACDPDGRFWVGSMRLDETKGRDAALYRYDGALHEVFGGVSLSNGIGWSPDRSRMYYIDTLTRAVDVFDYDGEPADRRTFARIESDAGFPDGLTVDDEGGVWVALWSGSALRRYGPDGSLDRVLEVPALNVTSCCFGGADGRALFITTAAPDGRVFVADPGVSGPPAQPFRRTAPSDAGPTSAR
ncbi:MAG: SMP-30/gluconolactonase/LRE family protein [Gaiellaceae bacterium]